MKALNGTEGRRISQATRLPDTEEFRILVRGLFPRTAVTVEYHPGHLFWEPSAEDVIDRAWHTYVQNAHNTGMRAYNGALFRLDAFDQSDGDLHLSLTDADFRSSIGTASEEFRAAFPGLQQANPLTVSITLVTGDSKIVLEKRSRLDSRRRPYHVIAGYMERGRDLEGPHPFDTLEREVLEELGVNIDSNRLCATGLVRTIYGSELCFYCNLSCTFDDLMKRQECFATDAEIERLYYVEDSPSALAAFLVAHSADLVPSGRASLLFYGQETYGNDWYETAQVPVA
jgi:hypothetical protein